MSTPRVLSIYGKTQCFGIIDSFNLVIDSDFDIVTSHWADSLIVCLDPIIISSVLATLRARLLAFSQQVGLIQGLELASALLTSEQIT